MRVRVKVVCFKRNICTEDIVVSLLKALTFLGIIGFARIVVELTYKD